MNRDNLAKLCALLSAFSPLGNNGVDTVFGAVWDEATKGMSNEELASFHRLVNELQAEIESEDTVGVEV